MVVNHTTSKSPARKNCNRLQNPEVKESLFLLKQLLKSIYLKRMKIIFEDSIAHFVIKSIHLFYIKCEYWQLLNKCICEVSKQW